MDKTAIDSHGKIQKVLNLTLYLFTPTVICVGYCSNSTLVSYKETDLFDSSDNLEFGH